MGLILLISEIILHNIRNCCLCNCSIYLYVCSLCYQNFVVQVSKFNFHTASQNSILHSYLSLLYNYYCTGHIITAINPQTCIEYILHLSLGRITNIRDKHFPICLSYCNDTDFTTFGSYYVFLFIIYNQLSIPFHSLHTA